MTILATESFVGSNADPIGGNWTTLSFASVGPIKRSGNLAMEGVGGSGAGGGAYYNALSAPADTYTKITIANTSGGYYLPLVRVDNAAQNMYAAFFDSGSNLGSTFKVTIFKFVANSLSLVGPIVSWTNTAPSVLEMRAIGSTISVWQDAVQLISITDTDITAAGRGGIRAFGTAGISDFEMGDFSSASSAVGATAFGLPVFGS